MIVQEIPMDRDAIDRLNQDCYDNCASYWDRFPFPNDLPKLISKYYVPNLGKRVLDVGSGTGVLASWLAGQGFDVLCIDPSPEMVKRCRSYGLNTIQSSLQNYQIDNTYAMIMAILSLIHLPKAEFEAEIQKLASALPEGGLLFLGMLEGTAEGIDESGSTYPRFFSYYTPSEILKKVKPYLKPIDYAYHKSGNTGYMLFVFRKEAFRNEIQK